MRPGLPGRRPALALALQPRNAGTTCLWHPGVACTAGDALQGPPNWTSFRSELHGPWAAAPTRSNSYSAHCVLFPSVFAGENQVSLTLTLRKMLAALLCDTSVFLRPLLRHRRRHGAESRRLLASGVVGFPCSLFTRMRAFVLLIFCISSGYVSCIRVRAFLILF